MRLADVTQSQRARLCVVLIAFLLMLTLIAVVFSLSRSSPQKFEMEDLYGWLD
jgi:uncharacterized protein YpmS